MENDNKTVLVTGTFDGIHAGHINLFKQAREYGDRLTVIVARDQTVERVKGKNPANNEEQRLNALQALEFIDQAVLGSLDDPYQAVADLNPDVIALGYDQVTFTDRLSEELKKHGCEPRIVRLKPYYPEKYKSSRINKH